MTPSLIDESNPENEWLFSEADSDQVINSWIGGNN